MPFQSIPHWKLRRGSSTDNRYKDDENTAYLGISGGTLSEDEAAKYGYPQAFMSAWFKRFCGRTGRTCSGRYHYGFNGETISTMEELQEKLEACMPGDQVTLTIQRQIGRGTFTESELATILGSKADMKN
ncbi:MAG: hypothetical protein ACLSFZ_08405 [Frisingicoccus sp.]